MLSSELPTDHHHHHHHHPPPPPSSSSSSSLQSDGVHPATPASLMRLPNGSTRSRPGRPPELKLDSRRDGGEVGSKMDFSSPSTPAALPSPGIMAEGPNEASQTTPTWTGRARPPLSVATSTSTSTPTSTPTTTTATHSPFDGRKSVLPKSVGQAPVSTTSTTGGRAVKKRTNSTSVQMSPSLRPKISPSIKPLLPEGGEGSRRCSLLVPSLESSHN